MAISFRIIYWIPVALFFILNMTFRLIIFLLQHFGNGIVWCNKQFVKVGDYFTDKAQNDNALDDWLEKLQKSKEETKKRVDAKRSYEAKRSHDSTRNRQ